MVPIADSLSCTSVGLGGLGSEHEETRTRVFLLGRSHSSACVEKQNIFRGTAQTLTAPSKHPTLHTSKCYQLHRWEDGGRRGKRGKLRMRWEQWKGRRQHCECKGGEEITEKRGVFGEVWAQEGSSWKQISSWCILGTSWTVALRPVAYWLGAAQRNALEPAYGKQRQWPPELSQWHKVAIVWVWRKGGCIRNAERSP